MHRRRAVLQDGVTALTLVADCGDTALVAGRARPPGANPKLSDTRRSLPPWQYGGTARMQRRQLAAPHTAMCLPALQEWLPVEALPELVAAFDAPLPPDADGAERPRSRGRVGE